MTDFEPQRGKFAGHGIEVTFIRRFIGDRREDRIESIIANGRPLVVIDPEDREAVERLRVALVATYVDDDDLFGLQDGLREFASPAPPKPEEPTATGTIVHDCDGEVWVRYGSGEWSCLYSRPGNYVRTWAELVEQYGPIVLSEGVSDA